MKPLSWLGIVLIYTALTFLSVYLIPSESVLFPIRAFLGYTFVVFVPGYCLVTLLFQEGKLDLTETLVLSVALSFSIAGISGLFLGLSPIGITLSSVTQTLTSIVVVLAALAFLRKKGKMKMPNRRLNIKPATNVIG